MPCFFRQTFNLLHKVSLTCMVILGHYVYIYVYLAEISSKFQAFGVLLHRHCQRRPTIKVIKNLHEEEIYKMADQCEKVNSS